MRENITAIPVGDYQIVVVHMDAEVERFGRFETEDEAVQWAMENRSSLGLARCASWHVERLKDAIPGKAMSMG